MELHSEDFETVYPVEGEDVLTDDELANMEEHNRLYFTRNSRYEVFHDCPAPGALERNLRHSSLDGPYRNEPETVENSRLDTRTEQAIETLIPEEVFPLELEDVSLIQYKVNPVTSYGRSVAVFHDLEGRDSGPSLDGQGVRETVYSALDTLRENYDLEEVEDDLYRSVTDEYVLELSVSETPHIPSLDVAVLGKDDSPREIARDTGIDRLSSHFSSYFRALGCFRQERREGFAYDLDLAGINLAKLEDEETLFL